MSDSHISRRRWLAVSPFGAGWVAVLAAQEHAHDVMRSAAPAALTALSPAEAMEISAIASQIIPSGESPGAREAGVIYFIDRALATFDADKRALYTKGLEEAERKRAELFPGSTNIAELHADQQVRLLEAIENTEFFEQVRTHCIMGFFGNPGYGGNRGLAGWKLIGFEDRFQFEPPFGYYDRPDGPQGKP
jgi:gluconate 2-dehydrogenase gamma chain